jgi:hypothetical protein
VIIIPLKLLTFSSNLTLPPAIIIPWNDPSPLFGWSLTSPELITMVLASLSVAFPIVFSIERFLLNT